MSEVKLNLVDSQKILTGTIHGSVADRCVAALSAEPETIEELANALGRYIKPDPTAPPFACFVSRDEIDSEPWDAGIVMIDLAARVVAVESSYSQPSSEGEVCYHDGTSATEVSIPYLLSSDWLFVNSLDAYEWSRERRRAQRQANAPIDTRAVLYGSPLLDFIIKSVSHLRVDMNPSADDEVGREALAKEIVRIHAEWLLTRRDDLRAQSPREVMLEKQDLIDRDLDSRCLQWSFLGEGPPCLPPESFAYRFAGFGTHEWVVYYALVRNLLWRALDLNLNNRADAIGALEQIKNDWLETGDGEFDGRAPANIIDNERRRLPQAMSPQELIIDEDCECCRMMAQEAEMGFGPGFWHLDGCNMEDEFAFSSCLTMEAWEVKQREWEEFNAKFERERAEREERRARGEFVEPYPWEHNELEAGEDPF
jgi:hypothetical protein